MASPRHATPVLIPIAAHKGNIEMKDSKKIDYERAKLLMDTIVAAQQHGPLYQKLASEAGLELKRMLDEDKVNPTEMPAAGGSEVDAVTKVPLNANPSNNGPTDEELDRQAREADERHAKILPPRTIPASELNRPEPLPAVNPDAEPVRRL